MEKIKKEYVIEKSHYPEEGGKYILFYHIERSHSSYWRGIFKGKYRECIAYRNELLYNRYRKDICSYCGRIVFLTNINSN